MINGIIKLFYAEVVKSKINKLPNCEYSIRDECKDINNFTLKVDSVLTKILSVLGLLLLFYFSYNINKSLGITILVTYILVYIYKYILKNKIINCITDIKSNIDINNKRIFNEKVKSGINILSIILITGFISEFNWVLFICFVIVFLFTIKNIYSNMK